MPFRVAEAFIQLATRGFDEVIAQIGTLAGQAGDLGGIVPALDFSVPAASASGLGAAVNGVADGMDRLVNSTRLVTQSMGQLAAITSNVGSAAGVAQARIFNYRVEGVAAGAQVAAGFKLTTAELGQVLSRLAAVHPLLGRMGSLINGVSFAVQTLGVSLAVATGGLLAALAAVVAIGAAMKVAFERDESAQKLFESIKSKLADIAARLAGPVLNAMEVGLIEPLNRAITLLDEFTGRFSLLSERFRVAGVDLGKMLGDAIGRTARNVVIGHTGGVIDDLLKRFGIGEEEDKPDRGGDGGFVALEEFAKQLQAGLNKDPQLEESKKQTAVQERMESHLAKVAGVSGGGLGPSGPSTATFEP